MDWRDRLEHVKVDVNALAEVLAVRYGEATARAIIEETVARKERQRIVQAARVVSSAVSEDAALADAVEQETGLAITGEATP